MTSTQLKSSKGGHDFGVLRKISDVLYVLSFYFLTYGIPIESQTFVFSIYRFLKPLIYFISLLSTFLTILVSSSFFLLVPFKLLFPFTIYKFTVFTNIMFCLLCVKLFKKIYRFLLSFPHLSTIQDCLVVIKSVNNKRKI